MGALDVASDRSAPQAERIAACEAAAAAAAGSTPQGRYAVWSKLFPIVLDKTEPVPVREAAAWAGRHLGPTAVNNLVAHAVPEAPPVRRAMVRALAEIAAAGLAADGESRIRQELDAFRARPSYAAAVNLPLMFGSDPRVLDVLRHALKADATPLRRAAVLQLTALGDMDAAVQVLRGDPSAEVRAAAADALGYYWTGEGEAADVLLDAQDDPDPAVAAAATKARRRLKLAKRPRPRPAAAGPTAEIDDRYPWLEFLRRWSRDLLSVEEFALTQDDAVVEGGWLGFPAAAESEIATLEARLGRRLPRSYRSFLATTNGFRGGGPAIRRIRPAGEVKPFGEEEREWVEIWAASGPPEEAVPLRTAVQVSDVGDGAVYLLCPDVVHAGGEWEAWLFANWVPGARRYASWWALLQAEHQGVRRTG